MTILKQNTAEGGTDGTTPGVGNTGGASGDEFDGVSVGTQFEFDSSQAMHGALSYMIAQPSTPANAYADWNLTAASQFYGRIYIRASANPTTSQRFFRFLSTSTVACSIALQTNGKLRWYAGSNGNTSVGADSATTLSTGTWYRVEVRVQFSASAAVLEAKVFSGDSSTPLETLTTLTAQNTGGVATANRVRVGAASGGIASGWFWFDDVAVGDAAGGWIGPPPIGDTAPQGGALGNGNAPMVATVVANAGAVGDANMPAGSASVAHGGATAGSFEPIDNSSPNADAGGSVAAGNEPSVHVALQGTTAVAGGQTLGSAAQAPASGSAAAGTPATSTAPAGVLGAMADGIDPVSSAAVDLGATTAAGGELAGVRVAVTPGGAVGAGNSPTQQDAAGATASVGGALASGITPAVNVTAAIGGADGLAFTAATTAAVLSTGALAGATNTTTGVHSSTVGGANATGTIAQARAQADRDGARGGGVVFGVSAARHPPYNVSGSIRRSLTVTGETSEPLTVTGSIRGSYTVQEG